MFNSDKKVKVKSELYSKLEKVCEIQGCASVDEYIAKTLESDADKILADSAAPQMSAEEIDKIASKLQGLGYLE